MTRLKAFASEHTDAAILIVVGLVVASLVFWSVSFADPLAAARLASYLP